MVRTPAFITLALLLAATPTFAEERAATPIRAILDRAEGARDALQNTQNARLEVEAEMRAEMQASTSAPGRGDVLRLQRAATNDIRRDVRSAVRWYGGVIRERFSVATRQFDRIITRIESRIEKLQAAGIAAASVEAELTAAKTAVATAKTDAQALASFVAAIGEAEDRAAARAELTAKIRTAQASTKAAHQALMQAVRALAAIQPRPNAAATTTINASASTTNE